MLLAAMKKITAVQIAVITSGAPAPPLRGFSRGPGKQSLRLGLLRRYTPRNDSRAKDLLLLFLIFFLSSSFCFAQDVKEFPPLTKEDRILILAPHPDDETIGTGGIIQEARRLNIPVKIVYLTNGDHNELAFLVYKKRPVLSSKEFLKMGQLRQTEAAAAMKSLGLKDDQLIFLGYPDGGTAGIFTQYWGNSIKPFKNKFTRAAYVPYKECLSFHAAYVGESILKDLENVLLDFQPTRIFVSHPADTNGDHRAFPLFLQVALWDLRREIPAAEVYAYLVHVVGWPKPRGFHPEEKLEVPARLTKSQLNWCVFTLTEEQIQKKKESISYYRSQLGYSKKYLFTFVRQNELFSFLPKIFLKEEKNEPIDWDNLETAQGIVSQSIDELIPNKRFIHSVTYAQQKGVLYVRVKSEQKENRIVELNIYLIGYKKGVSFSSLPKYRLKITRSGRLQVFEKERPVIVGNADLESKGGTYFIHFPLNSLDDPDYILTSARTRLLDLPEDSTAWWILKLK